MLIGIVLAIGFVSPFLADFVAERQLRRNHRTTAGSPQSEIDQHDPIFPSWNTEPPDLHYRYAQDSAGHIHFDLRDKPANLVMLVSHPESIEPELKYGRWLVLLFSTLSGDSVRAALTSPDLARQLIGRVRVAVRPTQAFEGTKKWVPDFERYSLKGHPFWFVFENGIVVRRYEGWMNNDQAADFAQR